MRILQESKKNAAQMQGLQMKRAEHQAELQQLSQELETDQGILQTLLPGSEDHLKQLKDVFDKQATLESRKQYYQQLLAAQEQDMTQKIYKQALEVTSQVAAARGLTLVLEQSPPEFPVPADRFLFAISSHKVLYAKGCVDITDEVLAQIDQ
jgi:Skp family chaperone for outer membrane proteins